MSIATDATKKVIRDKVAAEIETAVAKLMTLKAEAESSKADFEIKAITELLAKQHEVLHKLHASK